MQIPAHVDTVHIHRNLHLRQVSEVLGIPLDDLRDLNPQYYKDILPGASGPEVLRLPFNYTSAFLDREESIYEHRKKELFTASVQDGREAVSTRPAAQRTRPSASSGSGQWVYYTVKSGDVLGKIARRHRTTVKQIKAWNNLKSDRISVGQKLKVGKK